MRSFASQVFAVLVAFAILGMLPVFFLILVLLAPRAPLPPDAWLVFELNEPLLEHYPPPTLSDIIHDPPTCLMEVTENLEKAAADDRITGVLFKLDGFAAGPGKVEEIREGIRRVREAGKRVYAYAHQYDDTSLLLASECDTTTMFPKGTASFMGRGAIIEHIKGSLEKLGVKDNMHRIENYKSAAELFTSKEASPETLENVRWILEEVQTACDSIFATNRGMPVDSLPKLRNRALFRGDDAVIAGLIDETADLAELEERLSGGGSLNVVFSSEYADVPRKALGLEGRHKIAVVHAQGFVTADGEDRYEPVVGLALGADRVIENLQKVGEDDHFRAVVLRWDSGGGATAGGERIAQAVAALQKQKPVIVCMADEAASAAYMMSQDANCLVCPRLGITGSIGSLTGKMNLRGLYDKLGITFDEVALSPHALFHSSIQDYTEEQWRLLTEDHWAMYREWIGEIAAARRMTPAAVDSVARGKVWTGRQAKERGLVDELGTFFDALAATKRLADLPEDEMVTLVHFPAKRTMLQVVLEGDLERIAAASFHGSYQRTVNGLGSWATRDVARSPFHWEEPTPGLIP